MSLPRPAAQSAAGKAKNPTWCRHAWRRGNGMDPIRLGIIGLGGRGRSLAHVLRSAGRHLFTIVGVSDFFPGKVEAALRELELPFQAGHTDYWKLLANPGIEAVLVETGADTMAA